MLMSQPVAFAPESRSIHWCARQPSWSRAGRPAQRFVRLPGKFSHARDHCCSRRYAELAEDPPHVGAYSPCADIEDRSDHFVGVTLGDQADDFELARAQTIRISRNWGQSHQEISSSTDILIHQHTFRGVVIAIREIVQAVD
jgi:hypothetical protein